MNVPPPTDWNHIRAFLTTAETGSLSAAARRLGLTQPTLSRQVAMLESELDLMLFERVGRRLVLTQAGQQLLNHSRRMGEAAAAMSFAASGQAQAIEGTVRITASDMLSSYLLPTVLQKLRHLAPNLRLDLIATNDIRDLMKREADIAIRHVRPEQPDLIAQHVLEGTARFYAATRYLDRRGRPDTAEDLAAHDFVGFGDVDRMIEHFHGFGLRLQPGQFKVNSQNGLVAWDLVRSGFGIAPMYDKIAQQTPDIERVMHWVEPVRFPFWLTTHRELHTSKKIRLVFDLLADTLRMEG
ncbi:LysR family transcriptional regulator [Epibacterium sp. Ofav1-8]|uniref:LysR family transcriptional regulator n=1 Tax=Epibacterium sp. Ofav1-8 TaxID=2917735 RepID=UPI001EF64FB2|nr:LysR family transcriptional regulator [Epibacterium sp. Ofav1-8]MCG7624020.1 LysR family transcriptional regulator [Epibacterium sp. Ofav1-8]